MKACANVEIEYFIKKIHFSKVPKLNKNWLINTPKCFVKIG